MEDQNPIYEYLKEQGMTDLDEQSFLDKYSQPENAKEVYSYIKEQDMTDLSEEDFTSKYLKKKDQPTEDQSTESLSEASQSGMESTQEVDGGLESTTKTEKKVDPLEEILSMDKADTKAYFMDKAAKDLTKEREQRSLRAKREDYIKGVTEEEIDADIEQTQE